MTRHRLTDRTGPCSGPPLGRCTTTVHGKSVAVVLSRAALERLSGHQASLLAFMQASPMAGLDDELVIERDASLTRDVVL